MRAVQGAEGCRWVKAAMAFDDPPRYLTIDREARNHHRSRGPSIPSRPFSQRIRAETALLGTAIEIEHPTILPQGTEIRRVSEITLPAGVVLAWSLFVLLAIGLSFIAGLLMGHFIWKTH